MEGLTTQQVNERIEKGQQNAEILSRSTSVGKIIVENVFTLFNLVNVILGVLVAFTGQWKNMLFLGVAICNTAIGIFQQIRAKRAIDRLTMLSQPEAVAIRDGREITINVQDIVLDDVLKLKLGDQVSCDMVILSGEVEVNESMLSGESENIYKETDDELFAGSFITSGICYARVTRVGEDSVIGKMTKRVKRLRREVTPLIKDINFILKVVGIIIIPIGALMFFFQVRSAASVNDVILSCVAAIVGMIPEGLYLITSVALAMGVLRISRMRTLIRDIYSMESLARVDMLCLDKTGTLTTGKMLVGEIIPLDDAYEEEILRDYAAAISDENSTMAAIREHFGDKGSTEKLSEFPFSSSRKFSELTFLSGKKFRLGAAEVLTKDVDTLTKIETLSKEGKRVLLFGEVISEELTPFCLVVITDEIRDTAGRTIAYFQSQDVGIKVISGDNEATVKSIAEKCGITGKAISIGELSDEEIISLAEDYDIFARVLPGQKEVLIDALQKKDHFVAMVGDGANDVMALKKSDCSIAMASGAEAAKQISKLVLLDSDFSVLPTVVDEGRRVISNIQKTASLFLVKTIFSIFLSFFFLISGLQYPFQPIQLTLLSTLGIGMPAFFLALEPNFERFQGGFLKRVVLKALPVAIIIVINIIVTAIFERPMMHLDEFETLCVMITSSCMLMGLIRTCMPFNIFRAIICTVVGAGFILAFAAFSSFFSLVPISGLMLALFLVHFAASIIAIVLFDNLVKPKSDIEMQTGGSA